MYLLTRLTSTGSRIYYVAHWAGSTMPVYHDPDHATVFQSKKAALDYERRRLSPVEGWQAIEADRARELFERGL